MSKITEQFVPYKQAKQLQELGFKFDFTDYNLSPYAKYVEGYPEEGLRGVWLDENTPSQGYIYAPLYSQAFDWFREKHDLDIIFQLIYYSNHTKKGYFLTIFEGTNHRDLLNYEEVYNDILEDSRQEVEGNYLNDELHDTLIFERKFAYKTYQEAQLACLDKLIELVKEKK